jgi:carbon-monoxide dehydrogenase small subunit
MNKNPNNNIVQITLQVNGEKKVIVISPDKPLLTTLRDDLHLTGAKPGCYNGDCGACTVLIDGNPLKSCIMLTMEAVNHEITTIEGLQYSPVQEAFIKHFAFQCGYCTPGFIMNAHALYKQNPNANYEEICEWFASNICRCTSYEEIENAMRGVLQHDLKGKN